MINKSAAAVNLTFEKQEPMYIWLFSLINDTQLLEMFIYEFTIDQQMYKLTNYFSTTYYCTCSIYAQIYKYKKGSSHMQVFVHVQLEGRARSE